MDLDNVLKKIKEKKAKRILIQVPEGLKTTVQKFAEELEANEIEVIISCESCYGACDLMDAEAKEMGCDLILHIGHTDFGVKAKVPVIYELYEKEFNPVPLLENNIQKLKKYKRICLVTTAQFLNTIKPAKEFLEKNGIEIFTNEQTRSGEKAQVLGCDYSAALPFENKVDCFLYLGTGIFHPLGLALKSKHPVFSLDFETGELTDFSDQKYKLEKIKAYHIGVAQDAQKFGILLTLKPGQMLLRQAEQIKKKLESKGKKAYILAMHQVTPDKIMGLDLEVLINCSCPRMNEDFKLFKKPILNPEDIDKI
ncbi:MAG: diphthamide biosynthesis enzyme Dph2 [Candidatus Aenigmatarchaeota archaeon]